MIEPINKVIEVSCTPDRAFDIFVSQVSTWWPLDKNSISAMTGQVAQSVMIEPRAGGRIYEIAHDGKTHEWGTVETFVPAKRLILNWHVNTPVGKASLVEVTFSSTSNGGTTVQLVHSRWEGMGEQGTVLRDGYNSGWVSVFETAYKAACERP